MLESRYRIIISFALVVLLCGAAVAVDYVATAQTRPDTDAETAVNRSTATASPVSDSQEKVEEPKTSAAEDDANERMTALPSSAGLVTIVGRALDDKDRGRPDVTITLHEADGTAHSIISDRSGNFRFEKISDGQPVVLSTGTEPSPDSHVKLQLAGETRVFWRTPQSETKNGKH